MKIQILSSAALVLISALKGAVSEEPTLGVRHVAIADGALKIISDAKKTEGTDGKVVHKPVKGSEALEDSEDELEEEMEAKSPKSPSRRRRSPKSPSRRRRRSPKSRRRRSPKSRRRRRRPVRGGRCRRCILDRCGRRDRDLRWNRLSNRCRRQCRNRCVREDNGDFQDSFDDLDDYDDEYFGSEDSDSGDYFDDDAW